MPAIRLFGRGWRVASDDFVFPGLFDLLISLIWLIASVIIYWKNDDSLDCDRENGKTGALKMYIYGVFILLHLIIICSIALVHCSKTGSIMDTTARRFVPLVLYIRIALHMVSIGWNTLGTVWAFDGTLQSCTAAPQAVQLVVGYIICNWILLLLAVVGVYIVFDPFGSKNSVEAAKNAVEFYSKSEDGLYAEQIPLTRNTKTWTRRFRKWCLISCLTSKRTKNALHEAGIIFGTVFTSADLVPTDVVAGLILLANRNRDANRDETIRIKSKGDNGPLSGITKEPLMKPSLEAIMKEDWKSPQLLAHFLKFAMATYSWPLALFDKNKRSFRLVMKESHYCGCLPGQSHPLDPVDDNCCFCHTSGVKQYADVDDDQFVHLCFSNKVYGTPFFVVKDALTKSIVIAIRGTMSLADIITDMGGWPAAMDVEGLPPSFKGHHGMILCAKYVVNKLDELKILPQLMEENPGYNLVITGTSLGAGTSAIMAMILKQKFPELKCYAFSPPGGLLSLDAAEYCDDFVLSVVYGNDIVPRLGIRTMEKLKYAVMDAIKDSKSPKYQIILGALCRSRKANRKLSRRRKAGAGDQMEENRKHSKDELIDPELGMVKVDLNGDTVCNNNCDSQTNNKLEPKTWVPCGDMWMPGEVVYMTETPEFKSGHNKSSYTGGRWRMRWADRKEFDEIIVHDRMIMDHMPYRMFKALKVLAQNNDYIYPLPVGR